MVKTIMIKRGAKMHILANGAGRNLRSTITNHLNIRIMEKIFRNVREYSELYILLGSFIIGFLLICYFNYLRVTYDLGWDMLPYIKFFLDKL